MCIQLHISPYESEVNYQQLKYKQFIDIMKQSILIFIEILIWTNYKLLQ